MVGNTPLIPRARLGRWAGLAVRAIRTALLVTLALAFMPTNASADDPLTLSEAERLAVERDPTAERYRAEAEAARQEAIADGTLPDPEILGGAQNIPIDDPGLDNDPMTQLQLGVRQRFPSGRHAERGIGEAQAAQSRAQAEQAARQARLQARKAYLERLHRERAITLLEANRAPFEALVDAAEREQAAGRADRQDALQAMLALDRLEDRILDERTALDEARARLARWIGEEAARRPLPESIPEILDPPDREIAERQLADHPRLAQAEAGIRVGQASVERARSAYRPDWGLEVRYGLRRADGMEGDTASDLVSAMVTVQLPLFPADRQDRQLAAGESRAEAARSGRREAELELTRELATQYDRWRRLGERAERYERRLVALATENAEAALAAYRADTIPFTALQQARLDALEMRLAALRVDLQRARAEAELRYLIGEEDTS